jgi:hypothetical protein
VLTDDSALTLRAVYAVESDRGESKAMGIVWLVEDARSRDKGRS